MNDNEKIMSDLSYTNKDFNSIYSELLDTAKKLTNKWDPSLSNESDPGVLLLKLNALVADKNNYNIDKNVLECFPLSVTQQSNARKLYDLLGYNMHWYRSAVSEATFQLLPETELTSSGTTTLEIPLWTQLTNKDKTICYTTLQRVNITVDENTSTVNDIYQVKVPTIEGTIHDFDVNGETNLTLANLDENLRLYFNETRIAENGIFISTNSNWVTTDEWKRVDNLASYSEGRRIYKFGVLPNSDTCYIEFPSDVADLITNTFNVKYIITDGVDGNTKANSIIYFLNEDKINNDENTSILLKDVIKIDQLISGSGGQDIETLDDAYRNYKKSIGTFNTLVTTQDYTSKIYNMESTGTPYLLSNLVVSDRTNDLNYSNHVIQWDGVYTNRKLINTKIPNTASSIILPFDLYLYMLNYTNPTNETNYDNGFKTTLSDSENVIKATIDANLAEIKSIQHNLITSSNIENGKALFNNLYLLKGQVTTYYKVTSNEKRDIENNIKTALLNNYSSRNIDFGSQPNYNDLIEVIKNSDSRINNVILNQPEYAVKCQKTQDAGLVDVDNIELIARMVLSGNVQLFKFDDDFLYDFNQSNNQIIADDNGKKNIESLTTETTISTTQDASGAHVANVKNNEMVQFVAPSYVTTKQYSVNVGYEFKGFTTLNIPANKDYKLPDGTSVKFTFVDSNNLPDSKTWPAGTVINSTFAISENNKKIQTGNSISIKEANTKQLKPSYQYIAVLNNDQTLAAKGQSGSSYILQENEYFIFTDQTATNLVILGSGTRIENLSTSNPVPLKTPVNLDLEKIYDASETKNWWTAAPQDGLQMVELSIYTLGSGGTIKSSVSLTNITNTYQNITLGQNDTITLTSVDGSSEIIEPLPDGSNWQVRSRLNINSNSTNPQKLEENQKFTFKLKDVEGTKVITGPNKYLAFNYPIAMAGGVNLDTTVITPTSTDYLRAYTYTKNSAWDKLNRVNGLLNLTGEDIGDNGLESTFNFDVSKRVNYYLKFNVVSTNGSVKIQLNTSAAVNYSKGVHYIHITEAVTSIKITKGDNFTSTDTLTLDYITKIDGYNKDDIDVEKAYNDNDNFNVTTNGEAIESKMIDIMNNSVCYDNTEPQFDWTYRVKPQDKVLQPTLSTSYFNLNHIYNKYTIAQIDTTNYNIVVNPYYVS